jgi:diadenosine tetraphosphate (Ap4A) HIT family hydrolase
MSDCPFCNLTTDVVLENEYAFSVNDRHPVSRGHSLIIPKKHVATVFELPVDDYHACFDLVRTVREQLQREHRPDGFNIGVNCGSVAGQTVAHAHVHLIPRYGGDVARPRGGVRNVIPGKGDY